MLWVGVCPTIRFCRSLWSESVIEWIAGRFPGKAISAVIVSHSHNDHAAGIRPFIAVGAAIVAHEAAVDFYRAQSERPTSNILPDRLDRNPTDAVLIGVSENGSYRIDDPERSVVVYPVATGHSNDMVMAFVSDQEFLYTGDLFVSGIARKLRRGGVDREPGILPFHSALSLDKAIRLHELEVSAMVGSHNPDLVTREQLEAYIKD